jgi:hypothetical protein
MKYNTNWNKLVKSINTIGNTTNKHMVSQKQVPNPRLGRNTSYRHSRAEVQQGKKQFSRRLLIPTTVSHLHSSLCMGCFQATPDEPASYIPTDTTVLPIPEFPLVIFDTHPLEVVSVQPIAPSASHCEIHFEMYFSAHCIILYASGSSCGYLFIHFCTYI